jgi:uncharacterized protein YcfL
MRIYLFLILISFIITGCKLKSHRADKSFQNQVQQNTSLKQLVNSLFSSVQQNDTLGYKKLILSFDEALAEVNKNVSLS